MASRKYWPIAQLTVSRLREFVRQPAAVFWVYGFPILMMLSLGMAFREKQTEEIRVDLVETTNGVNASWSAESNGSNPLGNPDESLPTAIRVLKKDLSINPRFKIVALPREDWKKRLQAGKTDVVIEITYSRDNSSSSYRLWDEPHRTESRLARYAVEAWFYRFEPDFRKPVLEEAHLDQTGTRYIDFLLPGMLGLGLMGGGLWGVGFVIVDMRIRKLLKRFLATPMRRTDFLLAIMFSRLIFTVGDIVVLLLFGWLVFHTRVAGSYVDLTAVIALGAAAFAGIGMLVASRAQTLETVSGLMNLVMLPMWVFSGVFFSSERFPEVTQPVINLLPLTALNQLLRGIMLEGDSIVRLWPQVALLAAYAVITFAIALRVFRWR